MTYAIKLHPKVHKFLEKLDNKISLLIKKRLKLLMDDNPFRFLEHYESEDCYKFRAGEYRALVDVDQNKKIIFIRVLDHRSQIYKRK